MAGFVTGVGVAGRDGKVAVRGRRAVVVGLKVPSPFEEGSDDDRMDKARKALAKQFEREEEAKKFDGYKLRDLLLERYGRCYDIQLKGTPWFNGQTLISVNIMWRYLEQQSFPLSEEEYLNHLEAVTRYLREWGMVEFFIQYVRTTKEKPRVAKAVAVPIELPPDTARRIKLDLDSDE